MSAHALPVDSLHQCISAHALPVDSLHQRMSAHALPVDSLHQCMSAHALPVDSLHQCMSAHALPVDSLHQCMSAHALPIGLNVSSNSISHMPFLLWGLLSCTNGFHNATQLYIRLPWQLGTILYVLPTYECWYQVHHTLVIYFAGSLCAWMG